MKSLLFLLPIAAVATTSAQEPSAEDPILGADTVHGCYSSAGILQLNETNVFNTQGSCAAACEGLGAYVAATQAEDCYCGNNYPPASTLVDDSQCSEPCPGYGADACGGVEAFTVINTGVKIEVADSTDDSSSSESSTALSSSTTAVSSLSSSVASIAAASETTVAATTTVSSSVNGTSSATSAGVSGSASASSSPSAVVTSGAGSRLSLLGLNVVALGLSSVFLL